MCCWLFLKGLRASVLSFFEQSILDAELGIENYRFSSGLTSGEVFQQRIARAITSMELHCKDKSFAEKLKVDLVNTIVLFL